MIHGCRLPRTFRHKFLYIIGRSLSFRPLSMTTQRAPKSAEKHLVWVDCEMTGLDPRQDKILEIAVAITDANLELVDGGIDYVIATDKKVLDGMGEWCRKQHASSGLTQACLASQHSHSFVEQAVLAYIKKWVPIRKTAVLAGNSVHVDRSFLVEHMPQVADWLHYRTVDVSSIKELCVRWYPSRLPPVKESGHRAMGDIRESIKELIWFRNNIFVPPEPTPPSEVKAEE